MFFLCHSRGSGNPDIKFCVIVRADFTRAQIYFISGIPHHVRNDNIQHLRERHLHSWFIPAP